MRFVGGGVFAVVVWQTMKSLMFILCDAKRAFVPSCCPNQIRKKIQKTLTTSVVARLDSTQICVKPTGPIYIQEQDDDVLDENLNDSQIFHELDRKQQGKLGDDGP